LQSCIALRQSSAPRLGCDRQSARVVLSGRPATETSASGSPSSLLVIESSCTCGVLGKERIGPQLCSSAPRLLAWLLVTAAAKQGRRPNPCQARLQHRMLAIMQVVTQRLAAHTTRAARLDNKSTRTLLTKLVLAADDNVRNRTEHAPWRRTCRSRSR